MIWFAVVNIDKKRSCELDEKKEEKCDKNLFRSSPPDPKALELGLKVELTAFANIRIYISSLSCLFLFFFVFILSHSSTWGLEVPMDEAQNTFTTHKFRSFLSIGFHYLFPLLLRPPLLRIPFLLSSWSFIHPNTHSQSNTQTHTHISKTHSTSFSCPSVPFNIYRHVLPDPFSWSYVSLLYVYPLFKCPSLLHFTLNELPSLQTSREGIFISTSSSFASTSIFRVSASHFCPFSFIPSFKLKEDKRYIQWSTWSRITWYYSKKFSHKMKVFLSLRWKFEVITGRREYISLNMSVSLVLYSGYIFLQRWMKERIERIGKDRRYNLKYEGTKN